MNRYAQSMSVLNSEGCPACATSIVASHQQIGIVNDLPITDERCRLETVPFIVWADNVLIDAMGSGDVGHLSIESPGATVDPDGVWMLMSDGFKVVRDGDFIAMAGEGDAHGCANSPACGGR